MWEDLSGKEPTKPPRYLVLVMTVNPRWSKCTLARLTIAGLTTSIDLVGLGKYPLAGLVVANKINTFFTSSKLPPTTASSEYYGCRHVGTADFNCSVIGSMPMTYRIITRGLPCVTLSQLHSQWPTYPSSARTRSSAWWW